MPNIKSAKKRVKVTSAKNLQNKMLMSNLRTVIKKAEAAIVNDDDNKAEVVQYAVKRIDQACADRKSVV